MCIAERCINCKSKKHVAYDELIGEEGETVESGRFDHGSASWKRCRRTSGLRSGGRELSRCIRCNACRDVCPACYLRKMRVRQSTQSGVAQQGACRIALRKKCSILSARSMWLGAAQTAENVPGFARSISRCTCSTASLLRILTIFTANTRQEKRWAAVLPLVNYAVG